MNSRSLVSLKLEKGWTDLANFGLEVFVEEEGGSKEGLKGVKKIIGITKFARSASNK